MKYNFIKDDDLNRDKLIKYIEKYGVIGIINFFKDNGIGNIINKPYLSQFVDIIFSKLDNKSIEILFNDKETLDIFIITDRCFNHFISDFDIEVCKKIVRRFLELDEDIDNIVSLFRCFDFEVCEKLLYLIKDRPDILYPLIERGNFRLASKIINNDWLDLVSDDIDIELLFSNGKDDYLDELRNKYENGSSNKVFSLSPRLITEELCDSIWNRYNIFKIRDIINDSFYVTNPLLLNEYVKEREDKLILESLKVSFLPIFQDLYDKYLIQLEINDLLCDGSDNDYFNKVYGFRNRLRKTLSGLQLEMFEDLMKHNISDKEELFQYIKVLNDELISNYIIDYHFEENYFNVMLDLQELVSFNDRGNICLDKDHLKYYRMILEIDNLDLNDKDKLHLELKKYNIMEWFYDDMLSARRVVNNNIKDSALNKDNIQKYKNEELSKYYGVDIYVIKDVDLCAIVKSDIKYENIIPTGYSYSLVGNKMVSTYKPYQVENFVYDASYLNPDQIIHVYPEDSYTTPALYGSDEASSVRLNKLLLSRELLEKDSDYSEILVMECGSKHFPVDQDIPSLPILALYCSDYVIPSYTISYAKQHGLGIVFVDKTMEERMNTGIKNNLGDINSIYYSGLLSKEYNEDRRKKMII